MLPKLPAQNTTTQPATTEKNFDSWFLTRLKLSANADKAITEFKCSRYDYDQKEISDVCITASRDAYTEVGKWQCWQDAMTALLNCVSLEARRTEVTQELQTKRAQRDMLEDTTELDSQIAALEDVKNSIETSMGPLDNTS